MSNYHKNYYYDSMWNKKDTEHTKTFGYQNIKYSPFMKGLISGGCVVTEMSLGGLFMENMKMEKQRTSLPYPTIGRNLLQHGLKGFHAGLFPWGIMTGFGKGFVLGGARTGIMKRCEQYGINDSATNLISGAGAGMFQGIYMSPMNLARVRVNQSMTERTIANPMVKMNWWQELKYSSNVLTNAVRTEGPGVIAKGMPMMMFKRSVDWGSRFYFIDKVQKYIVPEYRDPTDIEKLASAFTGCAISVSMATPIDRMMPLIQKSNSNNESVASVIKYKFKTEGVQTLFRGWGIRTIQSGWHTMFAVFIADKLYNRISSE